MNNIYRYDDINFNNINFDIPEKQTNFYYNNITYKNNPLLLKTSRLSLITNFNNLKDDIQSIEYNIMEDNLDLYEFSKYHKST